MTMRIMCVDDSEADQFLLKAQMDVFGHQLIQMSDGKKALSFLKADPNAVDLIIMDQRMPLMDGVTTVKAIKENPDTAHILIVMVTAMQDIKVMQAGLDAGIFYYLTKPANENVLRSVLRSAERNIEQHKLLNSELVRHKTSFQLIKTAQFTFNTLEEAQSLAAFTAHCFPDPVRVLDGLAALYINALEHGLLGVGFTQKTDLINNRQWSEEIERLQSLPENKARYVDVALSRKDNGIYVVVDDHGAGFDWQKYMQVNAVRASEVSGRGIALANAMAFDKLTYNEAGNQAVGFVAFQHQELDW